MRAQEFGNKPPKILDCKLVFLKFENWMALQIGLIFVLGGGGETI